MVVIGLSFRAKTNLAKIRIINHVTVTFARCALVGVIKHIARAFTGLAETQRTFLQIFDIITRTGFCLAKTLLSRLSVIDCVTRILAR